MYIIFSLISNADCSKQGPLCLKVSVSVSDSLFSPSMTLFNIN